MRIYPHVHCRDGKQSYKGTINRAFDVARSQGDKDVIIFDMPNTDPPVTTGGAVAERLALVSIENRKYYFAWLGLTSNPDQIALAVRSYRQNKKVIGFKLFAGKSVGDLAVIDLDSQFGIYKRLADLDYEGPLAVHCEREDLLRPDLWDPRHPISHSAARPKEAEIESVRDQIRFACQVSFKGVLHIVHVSCPESVELVKEARKNIRITCAATPHHLLLADKVQSGRRGVIYKINPPLRSLEDIEQLRCCLMRREITWIETDHAPHTIGEKLFPPYLSGFPSLYLYQELIEVLLRNGVSKSLIKDMTFNNIVKVFKEKLGGIV